LSITSVSRKGSAERVLAIFDIGGSLAHPGNGHFSLIGSRICSCPL
jgi:hypothetical protein